LEHEIDVTTTRDIAITFSGGGNKSFYQLGLLRGWGARLLERVAAVAACSAGACVAALYLSGREDEVWSFWQERRQAVTRNFEWRRLLRGQRPTPHHEPIYRELLLVAFEHGGLERICSQPFPLFVLTALPPRWCPMPAAMLLGLGAHKLEHSLRPDLIHSTFAARIGFQALAFDARECRTREELTDLILASSATPPFTSVGFYAGRRLLDGGIIDNTPAFLAERAPGVTRNLVLLTQPCVNHLTRQSSSRLYIAPAEPLQVKTWDYTRPHLLEATIARGELDAARYASLLDQFLGSTLSFNMIS
jgi:predicted acylesterase/phospholipase RssA